MCAIKYYKIVGPNLGKVSPPFQFLNLRGKRSSILTGGSSDGDNKQTSVTLRRGPTLNFWAKDGREGAVLEGAA